MRIYSNLLLLGQFFLFVFFFLTLPLFFLSLAISFPPSFALFAILSLYSSYWACDHTPWVFALLGLVISLQSNFRFSCCLAYVSRNAASLSFVLGQPFPLPLSISRQCRSLASSRFILGLLSSACLSFFSCLRPDISSDTKSQNLSACKAPLPHGQNLPNTGCD